ncbi:hypothetical protein FHS19_001481 [Paenibacillus rhizosphaerae]|uniref:Uncharacterized protein n=1 Tax=Paenibacillus rhizosphaerae TaxID=297318 RepID=A0A839TQ00_9BACL|nr:hypothetical protein [Paenibacillus rhizosphaerae]
MTMKIAQLLGKFRNRAVDDRVNRHG